MSTLVLRRPERHAISAGLEYRWLLAGLALAFAMPFLFTDLIHVPRDLYYGMYVTSVTGFVGAWARQTHQPILAHLARRRRSALAAHREPEACWC